VKAKVDAAANKVLGKSESKSKPIKGKDLKSMKKSLDDM
jgi:hypothetical protein